jgi:hypothetical protein
MPKILFQYTEQNAIDAMNYMNEDESVKKLTDSQRSSLKEGISNAVQDFIEEWLNH